MDWMKTKVERRQFMKLLMGAASATALSGYAFNKLAPSRELASGWPGRIEEWIPSTCLQCPGGCGVLARVVDGNLVKLEGNPLHPINRGRLCPLGQAGLQLLYHPDRIKMPMKRIGGKGSHQWVSIGWDEAIDALATQLGGLRERGEAHALVVLNGQPAGLMGKVIERFCAAFGTPNHIHTDEPDGMSAAHALMQGLSQPFGYDLENANYILSFGCALLDGWRSPVQVARAYGYLRQERPGSKAKIVQIDRRLSTTAARSDEWIPIHPGTEGALALGIAYVLIREDLYDHEFVANYTFGFDDWTEAGGVRHQGFKRFVLQEYRPEEVSGITGVPVATLIRVAKEFAANKPALAIGDANATLITNGTFNAMAIHALNALVGSLDARGGVLIGGEVPFQPWPVIESDATTSERLSMPRIDHVGDGALPILSHALEAVSENILSERPYKVNAVFLSASNPVFATSAQARFGEALEKVPLVVSFASFMDESTEYADLILPDHTYLEKWQDGLSPSLSGIPVLGVTQPVVKPLYNTRHTGDVILELAGKIGGALAEALPWKDFEELLRYSVQGIHQSQYGSLFSEPLEEALAEELQQRGWWSQPVSSFDEFWDELVRKGGWTGLSYTFGKWGQIFQTPSGKFEFYSQRLKTELAAQAEHKGRSLDALLNELKIEARGDKVFLPHYEPIRTVGDESEYPLHLNPFPVLVLNSGASAHLPWVQELAGLHVNMKWDSWLEIHPETARELGIGDGDSVWVESPHGRARTRAKLYPGAMPDVVNVPYGLGHEAYGRWAKDRGVNPNTLIGRAPDPLSGCPGRFSTRVKVYKA